MDGRIDTVSHIIASSPNTIFQAFMNAESFEQWMPPEGMSGTVEYFDPQTGGSYRMTLTYEDVHSIPGKTSEHSDTVETIFEEVIPDKKIIGVSTFETEDPDVLGAMKSTWYFEEVDEGTKVTIIVENVPKGIPKPDHIEGLTSTLKNLETFVINQSTK